MSSIRFVRNDPVPNSNRSITFIGLLQIAFIVLKLCGVINWSWWWVLAPIWGYTMIIVMIVIVLLGVSVWHERKS